MNRRNRRTLEAIFEQPTRSDVRFAELESLLRALGARKLKRKGSRRCFVLPEGAVINLHEPHPRPELAKYQVEALREFLEARGITPEP